MRTRRPAPRVVTWWHKWESCYAHGGTLWWLIKHNLFGSRFYTYCMRQAAGCAQCAVSMPASARKERQSEPTTYSGAPLEQSHQ